MLSKLSIQNFALIDFVEIDLTEGLTVITGETGAGKSILLGALSLILGNRADHSTLKDQSKKCVVEGLFELEKYYLEKFFEKYDLDFSTTTIIRREITPQGKSRSFINDTPVTLEVMRHLGVQLIDIHSQHQSLQINNANFQLNIVDVMANSENLLSKYAAHYAIFQRVGKELEETKSKASEARKQEDYLNFQFSELETLNLQEGEVKDLEQEQERFANSEEILKNLSQSDHLLSKGDQSVLDALQMVRQALEQTQHFHNDLKEIADRFSSVAIELQDISQELELQLDKFQYHPERHQIVEERLATILNLQRKHQLSDAEQLIKVREEIEIQLQSVSDYEHKIQALSKKRNAEEEILKELSADLSRKRKAVLPKLKKAIEKSLIELGMPHAKLEIEHEIMEQFRAKGCDQFEFLFSANKGIAPQQIANKASGGEISRLMLSIKSAMAKHKQLPTILFDEIDTGVSGQIAEKMGEILKQMSKECQVISITHLPQLAAKGSAHYFVYKSEGEVSQTNLKKLDDEERVEELAKMLSGKSLSDAAINNAKELLTQ